MSESILGALLMSSTSKSLRFLLAIFDEPFG